MAECVAVTTLRRHGGGAEQTPNHQRDLHLRSLDFDLDLDFDVVCVWVCVVADVVLLVVVRGSVERIVSSASASARATIVPVLTLVGFTSWIACPRLMCCSTIRVFNSVKLIPRLLDTFTAATN